ncbi:hypothetical protein [Helicobacter pylori]|nr:hypothetical protein [Helicobacter pylori]
MSQFKGAKRGIALFLLKECGFEYMNYIGSKYKLIPFIQENIHAVVIYG